MTLPSRTFEERSYFYRTTIGLLQHWIWL